MLLVHDSIAGPAGQVRIKARMVSSPPIADGRDRQLWVKPGSSEETSNFATTQRSCAKVWPP